jgi:hypothetical protein
MALNTRIDGLLRSAGGREFSQLGQGGETAAPSSLSSNANLEGATHGNG